MATQNEDYWLKAAVFIGKCEEVFVVAVLKFHTVKAVVQVAAIEVTADHLFDIGPSESVLT